MHPVPSERVTFLFTDIEGSTRRWERDPEGMRHALARHDAVVRQAIEGHGGRVFKTVGDAFCAVLVDAAGALQAAVAVQRALGRDSRGDLPLRARALYEASLALSRELADQHLITVPLYNLAMVLRLEGDGAAARALYAEGLAISSELGDRGSIAPCLEGMAAVEAAVGQAERAARLLDAGQALREAIGAPVETADRPEYERCVAAVRAGLDEDALDAAWAQGRAMTIEEAVEHALGGGDSD